MEREYIVYIKTDERNVIVNVNSDEFLHDHTGWTEIDRGYGPRYCYAQGNYFPKPLMDDRGVYRYKLADGMPVERSQEEMDADWVEPVPVPTDAERITALEAEKTELKQQVTALSAALLDL